MVIAGVLRFAFDDAMHGVIAMGSGVIIWLFTSLADRHRQLSFCDGKQLGFNGTSCVVRMRTFDLCAEQFGQRFPARKPNGFRRLQ
jgi:hypothetical protein